MAKKIKFQKEQVEQLVWTCPECNKVIKGTKESEMNYNVERHLEKHYREKDMKKKSIKSLVKKR